LMHMAGKWAGKARAMANEFRKSFDEMARQAELDELRKEIDDLKKNNPLTEVANSVGEVGAMMSASAPTMEDAGQAPAEATVPVEGAGQTPAETTAPVEAHIEPRSGEFAVTDSAVPSSGPTSP
jgi:sec-independent protein translocase protein TatB